MLSDVSMSSTAKDSFPSQKHIGMTYSPTKFIDKEDAIANLVSHRVCSCLNKVIGEPIKISIDNYYIIHSLIPPK